MIDKKNTNFNHSIPTRVIISGFESNRLKVVSIKDEYFQNGDYNVVIMTWKYIEDNPEQSVHNIQAAGMKIFTLLDNITDLETSLNKTYFIGHGIGAHIAGYTGYLIAAKYNRKLSKIFALDPKYENTGYDLPNRRLHMSDANYVESILTTYTYSDSGPLPISHADYIVNDYFQISCSPSIMGPGNIELYMMSSCAHNRVLDYFAESIYSSIGFWGLRRNKKCKKCSKISKMGEIVGHETNVKYGGVFTLTTNPMAPYARGKVIVPNIPPSLKFVAIGLDP